MTARVLMSCLFVVLAAVLSLSIGTTDVDLGDVFAVLSGAASDATTNVVETRVPRVLLGLLVGAALAVSGVLFQALLRNDLAEPYLLGVGPGALLGVTVAALIAGAMPAALLRGVFAFAGAAGVTALVLAFARRAGTRVVTTVLLAGIAIGAFVSAIATAALHAAVTDWDKVIRWLLGDLGLSGLGDSALLAAVLALVGGAAFVRARDLDVLTLGEEQAWLGGVEVRRALTSLGGAACLLAAVSVALCGLVGFVGLAVPHLARRVYGPHHRALVPGAAALGAGLVALADGLSRTVFPPSGLPLGVVTAALGAPVLVVLLLRRSR